MDYLKKSERLLKHNLKNKRRITLGLIVAFLITGGIGFTDEEAEARDLRARNAKRNNITAAESGGPTFDSAANGTDVININKADSNGISHNKFIDFNVGADGIIFNNNATQKDVNTSLGGLVQKNTALEGKAASAILNEVTGNKLSNINGVIEVAGQRADFILSNENGITVNGGGFINTSGVTLTTGRPNINNGNINFDVTKGKVSIESGGVGTAGDHFNIIAKTIELKGKISAMKDQTDADINLIAGQNRVSLGEKNNPKVTEVLGHDKTGEKYGIYATELGAMYGRNIRLISTTEGLGVRHEGIISSAGDIQIDSAGDITIGGLYADRSIKIKGEGNFDTISDSYKTENKEYNYSIVSNGGIELEVTGDITIRNEIINNSLEKNIVITGKNLKVVGNKKGIGSILSYAGLKIKMAGDIVIDEILRPSRVNGDNGKVPLILEVGKDGNIIVRDPETGKVLNENEYVWISGGLYSKNTEIEGNNLTNDAIIGNTSKDRSDNITINIKNSLTNNNIIAASGDLVINSKNLINTTKDEKKGVITGAAVTITTENLENQGEIRQNSPDKNETIDLKNKVVINIKNGNFTNSGIVSGYNVEIIGENFKLINKSGATIIAGDKQYPYGAGNITIKAKEIENAGNIRTGGTGEDNNIVITAEILNNIGYILAQKGNLTINTTKSLINSGEIVANQQKIKPEDPNDNRVQGGNLTITGSGKIENKAGAKIGGQNITIKSTAEMTNAGIVAGVEKVLIEVNKFINAGTAEDLKAYLDSFYKLSQESLADAEKMLEEAKKENNQTKIAELQKIVDNLKDLTEKLSKLNVGMISGRDVEIKTTSDLENNGIIKGDESLKLTSGNSLKNTGILESSKNMDITATGDITNSNRIYAGETLNVKGKSFTSTGEDLSQYAKDKDAYNNALEKAGVKNFEELDVQITKLIEELKLAKDEAKIKELSQKIATLREQKQNIAALRAKVIGAGVGNVEAKNANITTTESIKNDGIIIVNEKLNLDAGQNIENSGILTGKNANLSAKGNIQNDGSIVTDETLTLKAVGDIKNGGNISVGTDANIEGKSFISEVMTVGENLIAKVQNAFESKSLQVQKDMTLEAANAKFTEELDIGGNVTINIKGTNSGNVIFGTDGKAENNPEENDVNITGNLTITGGGLDNKLDTAIGGNLSVNNENNNSGNFNNSGNLSVKNDTDIKTGSFTNSGDFITGGSLNVNATNNFNNSGIIQAIIKEQARNDKSVNITAKTFNNDGNMVFGGKTTINATDSFTNTKNGTKGSIEVDGELGITTTGKLTNSGKLQSTGKLTINSGDLENQKDGLILSNGMDITATGNINNAGSIQSKGDLNIKGDKNLTNTGEILVEGAGKIVIKESVTNSGKLQAGKSDVQTANNEGLKTGDLVIETGKFTNKGGGKVSAENDLKIKVTNGFTNEQNGEILGGNVYIDGTTVSNNNRFENAGNIFASGNANNDSGYLKIDLGENKQDITIESSGKLASNNTMTLITGGNISNGGKLQNPGGLDFQAGGKITNTGMLVSLGDIDLSAKGDIINGNGEAGSTIWSNKNVNIKSENGNITNNLLSAIEAKGDMALTAENGTILNNAGTIKAGGKLDIKSKKLENKSIVDIGKITITPGQGNFDEDKFDFVGRVNNGDASTVIEVIYPDIDFTGAIAQNATIMSGGDMSITTTEGAHNLSGKIASNGNMNITGNMKNETVASQIPVEEILKHVQVRAYWVKGRKETDIFRGNIVENLETLVKNTDIFDAIKNVTTSMPGAKEFLEIMDAAFSGKISTGQTNSITKADWKPNVKKSFYLANASASILAKGSITFKDGKIENIGATHQENQDVKVDIGGHDDIDGVTGGLGISVQDPNDITEVNGIKYPDDVEVIKGEVTIDGVTISGDGGTVSSIAVAGTINPIIYIDIPVGNNGVFAPAAPRPEGEIQYKFETNIDFIDPDRYYGSNYFFDKIGYDPDKSPTVIGDAYYEKTLIEKMIRETLGYTGEITEDNMKTLLDQATEVQKELGLEVGKALTPDQINNLEKDIIWYVEVEMDGEKVLVPQIYFGKETRIKMAQGDTGGGAGSNIKAGGDISIDGGSLTNNNSNISAGGNVDIKVDGDIENNASGGFNGGISAGGDVKLDAGGDIDMKGGTVDAGGDASLKAGGDINIESGVGVDENGDQTISNEAGISAGGDINIESGGDTNIKNGTVESSGGDINISGDNVNIEDQNLVSSEKGADLSGGINTTYDKIESKSDGSTIAGDNVNIKSKNDTNIKGSDVVAGDEVSIDAGGDVNITDGQDYSHEEVHSSWSGKNDNGLISTGSSSSSKTTSTSSGSTVGGVGGANIKSGGDINLKGSDVIGGEKGVNIEAEGDVNITDGRNTEETSSSSNNYNGVGYTQSNSNSKTSTSVGSGITSSGDINIKAGGDVKSVGSDIKSTGDTNIEAGGDVKFEAGKNTHEESSSSIGIGFSGGATAGAGGSSANAKWDIFDGGSTEVIDGNASDQTIDDMNKNGKGGKNYMDSLTKVEGSVGISVKNESKSSTTWTEGSVSAGGDLNIKSGGTVDIGGSDFETGGDFNVTAKDIDSTKYEDVHEESSSGFNIGIKVGNDTTSAIADAVNKGMQISESANGEGGGVNGALTGAQVGGSVSNIIFGDLVGNTTSVTGEIGYNKSSSKTTSENTTNIKSGGDINFKATDGDIDLKGVEMEGNDISLDAKGDINIESSQDTSKEDSFGVNISGGVTASGGVSAIDGGNAQLGAMGNAGMSSTNNSSETNKGSSINGKNITIKSGGDTNLIGSNVNGDNVSVDVGGDLNIETETDKIDESRKEGWIGADVSGGGSTNTIVTGDVGISAGGGEIYKKGDSLNNQAGINAKNSVDVNVDGDLNLKGGVVGSETGEGSLNVGGDLNVDDVHSNLEGGGAIVGGNGGTKGGGIFGEVGDTIDQEKTGKGTIGIDSDNITVGGDVTVNGDKNTGDNKLDGINTDMDNSLTIDKDESQNGGTFGGTASGIPGKNKGGKGGYDVPNSSNKGKTPDLDLPSTPPKGDSGNVVVDKTPPVEKGDVVDLPKPEKPETVPPVTPEGGNTVVDKTPPVEKGDVVDLPKPEKPETVPPVTPEGGNTVVDKTPPVEKGDVVDLPKPEKPETVPPVNDGDAPTGGWVKNPDTGKWEQNGGLPGIMTPEGPFGSKDGLDGFQKGVKGEPNEPKPPVKPPVTEGKWEKDPDTGKWVPAGNGGNNSNSTGKSGDNSVTVGGDNKVVDGGTTPPKGEGGNTVVDKNPPTSGDAPTGGWVKNPDTGKWEQNGGLPGAITSEGPFGSKDGLDGFQKGVKGESNEPKPPVKPPVTEGQWKKDPDTGKWVPAGNGGNNSNSTGKSGDNSVTVGGDNKVVDGETTPPKGEGGTIVTDKTPPVEKGESVDLPKPEMPETVPPVDGGSNNGWVKDPDTGKWTPEGGDKGKPGVVTPEGPFGSKGGLDGFQKGVEGLPNPTDPPARPPVTEGNYEKNSDTGKWEPAGNGGNNSNSTGKSGDNSVTVGGDKNNNVTDGGTTPPKGEGGTIVTDKTPLVEKGESVDLPKPEMPETVPPVDGGSNNGWVKDPDTGKWTPEGGDNGVPGVKSSEGPFGSKDSVDGFQKGVKGESNESTPPAKPPVTEGNYEKNPDTGKWEQTPPPLPPVDYDTGNTSPNLKDQNDSSRNPDSSDEGLVVKKEEEKLYGNKFEDPEEGLLDRLLKEQFDIANKPKLTEADKKRLQEIEDALKSIVNSINQKQNGKNGGNDLPPLPKPDYNGKNVSFDDNVEVKYVDENSTKPVDGGTEPINDKNSNKENETIPPAPDYPAPPLPDYPTGGNNQDVTIPSGDKVPDLPPVDYDTPDNSNGIGNGGMNSGISNSGKGEIPPAPPLPSGDALDKLKGTGNGNSNGKSFTDEIADAASKKNNGNITVGGNNPSKKGGNSKNKGLDDFQKELADALAKRNPGLNNGNSSSDNDGDVTVPQPPKQDDVRPELPPVDYETGTSGGNNSGVSSSGKGEIPPAPPLPSGDDLDKLKGTGNGGNTTIKGGNNSNTNKGNNGLTGGNSKKNSGNSKNKILDDLQKELADVLAKRKPVGGDSNSSSSSSNGDVTMSQKNNGKTENSDGPVVKREEEKLYGQKTDDPNEAIIDRLLKEQYEIANKDKLTEADKKRLDEIEKALRSAVDAVNKGNSSKDDSIEIPPAPDYPAPPLPDYPTGGNNSGVSNDKPGEIPPAPPLPSGDELDKLKGTGNGNSNGKSFTDEIVDAASKKNNGNITVGGNSPSKKGGNSKNKGLDDFQKELADALAKRNPGLNNGNSSSDNDGDVTVPQPPKQDDVRPELPPTDYETGSSGGNNSGVSSSGKGEIPPAPPLPTGDELDKLKGTGNGGNTTIKGGNNSNTNKGNNGLTGGNSKKNSGNSKNKILDDLQKELADVLAKRNPGLNKGDSSSNSKGDITLAPPKQDDIRPELPPTDYETGSSGGNNSGVSSSGKGEIPPAPPLPSGDELDKLKGTGNGGNTTVKNSNSNTNKGNTTVGGNNPSKKGGNSKNKILDDLQKELADVLAKRKPTGGSNSGTSSSSNKGDVTLTPPKQDDVRPELPPTDYEIGNSNGGTGTPSGSKNTSKKSVSFDENVEVKYVDENSTKPIDGGTEGLKDKE